MSRTFGLSFQVLGLAVVAAAATVELPTRPTPEYQNLMQSNATLVDLSASAGPANAAQVVGGRETNIESKVAPPPGTKTLRDLYKEKNYDGIAVGAEALKANYEKLEAFWTEKKAPDAVALAKAGVKAAGDMVEAAKAKNDKQISNAQTAIERTCRDCHTTHRVIVLTDNSFQIRISPTLFN